MTHYGTGPAPVLFGARYVRLADWWKLGATVSVVNVIIWLLVGGIVVEAAAALVAALG
jgi:DASS family divalent anion:Na+ symporter